ncbi:MFS transporter [Pseudonocardia sp. TRM90224]|uniref:MFS transporter n=1 Tax=Pseudonocardia sp. TRM90224 TaxID=2812678 RepID=UPI001E53DEEC|nr:MFS transporter [Pseudonocardia sp. TRM90224]
MSEPAPDDQLSQTRRSAIGGFLGTALEYFDFTLYGIVASVVLGRVFFAGGDSFASEMGAMATFGAAYIARPIGALVLGHLGDRLGRQRILLFTIVLMGASTFLIGCLPGYSSIGPLAPVVLVALRLAQGFSAAGEQAGSSTLTTEHAPPGSRGFYTSFTNAGTLLGNFLGHAAFIPVLAMPEDALLAWGWRLPFLGSAAGMVVVVFLRRRLRDADLFVAVKAAKRAPAPLGELFRENWKNLIRVVLCCLMAAPTAISAVFGLSYATRIVGLDAGVVVALTTISLGVGAVTIPFWAMLADRIGRRPVFIGGVLMGGAVLFVKFHFIAERNLPMLVLAQCVLVFFFMAGYATQLSICAEMFATKVRFSGVAVGTQVGYLLGGFGPTLSYAILRPGPNGWLPVAILGALCCLVASAAVFSAPETSGVDLERLDVQVSEGKIGS